MGKPTEIRIGTPGDYPPLTLYDASKQQYQGFDIDMANNLAEFLHKKIIFIKTSWPSLEQDLKDHKFDIAMGGISITPERAQQFNFSQTVLVDEKVAMFNCVDKSKYPSLNAINQPQVNVIENPGGTNERFARKHLTQANIIIFPDNTRIFSQLLNGQADVMITDSIEASYQQKLHPELCVLQFPETDREYKAYMLRKEDKDLLDTVNHWIDTIKQNNVLEQIKQKWL
jgi:cyclohexadienyl dehydratase